MREINQKSKIIMDFKLNEILATEELILGVFLEPLMGSS